MTNQGKKKSGLKDGLRLRGSGIYHFRFMHRGSLRTGSTGCRDLRSAQAFLLRYRSSLALDHFDLRIAPSSTFQEAFDLYLKVKTPHLAAKTLYNLKKNMEHHWSGFKDALLKDMQSHLDALFPVLKGKLSPGSQRLVFARLRGVLELARRRGLHNTPLEYPAIDIARDRKLVLDDDEIDVFFAHVDRLGNLHQQVLIRCLFYLGLRISECLRIGWDDYDEQAMTFRVDERQKSGKISYIPVVPEMAEWLAKLPRRKGELICPGKWGQHTPRYTDYIIKKASAAMGLQVPMTHHRLRASLATSLLRKGVSLAVVARILRHADAGSVCMNHYWEEGVQDLREGLLLLSQRKTSTPPEPGAETACEKPRIP